MLPVDTIVVHYNEIALKLGHRRFFVGRLIDNLRMSLAGLAVGSARSVAGRVTVEIDPPCMAEAVRRIALTPGVANVWCARTMPRDLDVLEEAVRSLLAVWKPAGSFRVEVRRADKSFPVLSPQIAAHLGSLIVEQTGAPVDLKRAETVVYVLITNTAIYLALDKVEGCGGLPVSTGGRVVLMLSGGIDSPVAGLRMMRRGCRLHAVHFHSVPYLSGASREKAKRLCAVLARGQCDIRLDVVPFGDVQREIVRVAPAALRVVLYRRMMLRIAAVVAREAGAAGIVTGDSLGQVASQTLANMSVIASATDLPLLRPLLGMDKREIMDYAKREDTYAISIVPDQDCCTLFVPKHPTIAARADELARVEAELDVDALIDTAISLRERLTIEPEWHRDPAQLAEEIA
jgi:thiamine biosynthesis protein ThiI